MKNKDWMEVSGVHWNIFQPRSASASTAGGHTAERVEMSDIVFTRGGLMCAGACYMKAADIWFWPLP
ncbi:type VI secretion system tube protein Hcp [Massilia solisilvae]|uniref:Type VI secretion system tube protein Hcp n=1 Tax=Massilia solisilvae TaxID=1811225 RepID=A0ABT2BK45_9BURK|nr:type VI secretion system tube protein Hcp [Massilia solisilvae]